MIKQADGLTTLTALGGRPARYFVERVLRSTTRTEPQPHEKPAALSCQRHHYYQLDVSGRVDFKAVNSLAAAAAAASVAKSFTFL